MSMLTDPSKKYPPYQPINLKNRQWPSRSITEAPIWMSTDLRDGNQAIANPMCMEKKLRFFEMLTQIGFKEIEIGYPSSNETEFDFARTLIEKKLIPDDVTIEVLTPAKEPFIRKTIDSVQGAKSAIVHVYNGTSKAFLDYVFKKTQKEITTMAVESVQLIKELTLQHPETKWTLQYSPEDFSQTDLKFARAICNTVIKTWAPTPDNKMILNLPATVEKCPPKVYADQIEWMSAHIANRNSVILSVHPHNDRGTAVAATEMAITAGADRVEGCLFGNGERTGNVDLVTVALNMYAQGVSPKLDFSNLHEIRDFVVEMTGVPISPRHPYAGEYVFAAYSGTHQNAIAEGMQTYQTEAAQDPNTPWKVPYLPVDPNDVDCSFENLIQYNSQSGRGGIEYILEKTKGIKIPSDFLRDFGKTAKAHATSTGTTVSSDEMWSLFEKTYIDYHKPITYNSHTTSNKNGRTHIDLHIDVNGVKKRVRGDGSGPLDAAVNALGFPVAIKSYQQQSLGDKSDAQAISLMKLSTDQSDTPIFCAGIHEDTTEASIIAIIGGINQAIERKILPPMPTTKGPGQKIINAVAKPL